MVIAENVLEHVANPLLAMLQIHRVLRDGGHALLVTPSSERLKSQNPRKAHITHRRVPRDGGCAQPTRTTSGRATSGA